MQRLPNQLTVARMAAIPVLIALLLLPVGPGTAWAAAAVFALAALTDFVDGWLARRHGATSDFGRLMDPIADKMLVAAALILLVAVDRLPGLHALAAVVILLREFFVSGLREFLAEKGEAGLPVSPLAKWKTTVQMVAIGLLILAPALPAGWLLYGQILLWVAAALTVATGADYAAAGLRRALGRPPQPPSGR